MNPSLYLVVGLGKTGHSIARYLRRRNQPFVVFDTRENPGSLAEFTAEFPDVEVFLGQFPDNLYGKLASIISSPGVPLDAAFIKKATQLGIPVYGDIECLTREINVPIIAITGTNGKSTVTTLVGEMAKAAGLSVAVAGNIGLPVLDMLDVGVRYSLWVLELSSFQLDLTYSLAPIAATILNITPDHLDRHHTLDAYIKAKQRVYYRAKTLVYNREDKQTLPEIEYNTQQMLSYGLDAPTTGNYGLLRVDGTTFLAYGNETLLAVDEILIKGKHNWLNALAACALADSVQIPREFMVEVLKRFAGLPHRSQWIRNINDVDWINDSKGTNVGATMSAISGIGGSMQGKIILIAGGQGKGADFSELRAPLTDYVRSVVLIGEDADKMEEAIADVVQISHATSLDAAVQLAQSQAQPGDVVLLSPACASFDMFRDFNHRGEDFIEAVKAL